jgi:hypothetical protein
MNFPPNPTMLWSEHMSMNLRPWTSEHEWIFLEYYDDVDKNIPMLCKNDVENIFHM